MPFPLGWLPFLRGAAVSAADVHAVVDWRDTLVRLGIPEAALTGRHTACPACGGTDRFRFDDRHGRGGFFCNGCGAGDGFDLLQRVHGWDFAEALRAVEESTGSRVAPVPQKSAKPPSEPAIAAPGGRIRDLLRTSAAVHDVPDAVGYLHGRHLYPSLPDGCTLRAHAAADYWHEGQRIGRFPALLAPVHDLDGELVSLHATYLRDGWKLRDHEPRKLLGRLTGRRGCAVRLGKPEGVLGIAEGVETALAAWHVHGIVTWAALSAAVLAKFEPPAGVERLVIFADRDVAGLEAAWKLRDKLTIPAQLSVPTPPAKDWADVLERARA